MHIAHDNENERVIFDACVNGRTTTCNIREHYGEGHPVAHIGPFFLYVPCLKVDKDGNHDWCDCSFLCLGALHSRKV